MKLSQLFGQTLRDAPAEAEVASELKNWLIARRVHPSWQVCESPG